MERVWIITHERFRNDSESYNVIAAFKTEVEAHGAIKEYGYDILMDEYHNKCKYDYMYGSNIYRIRENDISYMITQEDILRVIPVKVNHFDFKQNKILEYVSSN